MLLTFDGISATSRIVICYFQVVANALLLAGGNLIGYYYQFMSSQSQQRTYEQIRSTVESRVKLECEKEHQEQLLLSVIPAYIAAEVLLSFVFQGFIQAMPDTKTLFAGEEEHYAKNG